MYRVKKGDLVVLVALVLAIGILSFLTLKGEITLTGAAIGSSELAIPEEANLSENVTSNLIPESNVDSSTVSESVPEILPIVIEAVPDAPRVDAQTSCGDTIVSDLTLSGDVGPCNPDGLYIGANNIVVNCAGNNIIGTSQPGSFGVYVDGFDNVTIQNCNVLNFTNGLTYTNSKNGTILDSFVRGSSYGIIVAGTSNNVFINHTTIIESTIYGVNLNQVSNVSIINSNISVSSLYDINVEGKVGTVDNHSIYNNSLEGKILFDGNADGITVYNNRFWNVTVMNNNNPDNFWNASLDCNRKNILGGRCTGGNYYSNNTNRDTDDDSIINTNYLVPGTGGIYDFLPLSLVYPYYAPSDSSYFITNSTFNQTNPITPSSNHSARQNISFYNSTNRLVVLDAYFNATVNLTKMVIDANDSAIAVNLTESTGLAPGKTLYLPDLNRENGIIVCPNAHNLNETSFSCSEGIYFTYNNVTDGSYVNGGRVTLDGSEYVIENVSGTGALLNPNASLTVWDSTDPGRPYAGRPKIAEDMVDFYANYSDTGGRNISDANCTIFYHDGINTSMIFNDTLSLYHANRTYPAPQLGLFNWNVTCNRSRYLTLTTTDQTNLSLVCGQVVNLSLVMGNSLRGCTNLSALSFNINNTYLDCNGYTIDGSSTSTGLTLSSAVDNVTIKNCIINGFQYGTDTGGTSNNLTFLNNRFTNFQRGIKRTANANTNGFNVTNNTFYNMTPGILPVGIDFNIGSSSVNNNFLYNNFEAISTSGFEGKYANLSHNNFTSVVVGIVMNSGFIYNNTFRDINSTGISVYSSVSAGQGVYYNNITNALIGIKDRYNSNVSHNYVYNSTYGALFSGLGSGYFYNNTLDRCNYGVYINVTDWNSINNNTFINSSVDNLHIRNSDRNTILSNFFSSSGTSKDIVAELGSELNTFNNNTHLSYSGTSGGVYIEGNNNNSVLNSYFYNYTVGVIINQSNFTSVSRNTFYNNAYALKLLQSAQNTFTLNQYNRSNTAIYVDNSSYNLFLIENITNCPLAAYFNRSSQNNNLTNCFVNNQSSLIRGESNSRDNQIYNSSLNKSGFVTLDTSVVSLRWYVEVLVNSSDGSPLLNVNVSAYKQNGTLDRSKLTDENSLAQLELEEIRSDSGSNTNNENHTIYANISVYGNSVSLNLSQTNSTRVNITINTTQVGCGEVSNSTIILSDINVNGSCFVVTASNIDINGNGATLKGTGLGVGINLTNQTNVTIHNLYVKNFTIGLYLSGASNCSVRGNYVINNTNGLVLESNSNQNNISSNYFRNNTANGTIVTSSTGNYIYNNYFSGNLNHSFDSGTNNWNVSYSCNSGSQQNILSGDCLGGNFWGDYTENDTNLDGIGDVPYNISGGSNKDNYPLKSVATATCGNINTNTLLPPNTVISTTSSCYWIVADNLVFDGNGAVITGDGGLNDYGIAVGNHSNITIKNFNLNNFYYGIVTFYYPEDVLISHNVTLLNNTISASITNPSGASYALYLPRLNDSLIYNNSFSNYMTGSGTPRGAYLSYSGNIILSNNTFSSKYQPIYISNSKNITFYNGQVNSTLSDMAYLQTDGTDSGYNAYFVNVSFQNRTQITSDENSYAYVQWYADIHTENTSGSSLSGVNVTGYNALNEIDDNELSDASGKARLILTEFYQLNGVNYYLTQNHSITAKKDNYVQDALSLDLINTTSTNRSMILTPLSCRINLTKNVDLGSNLTASGDCFAHLSPNITINGNGYFLIGNGTGTGINLSDTHGINITRLKIINFAQGLVLNNVQNSKFNALGIYDNGDGISFTNSNNNYVYNSYVANNSGAQVRATNSGGTNNYLINSSLTPSLVSVNGTATLWGGWYVNVNVTYNNATLPLNNANVTGRFIGDNNVDQSKSSGSNGFAYMELSEWKKNSTSTEYFTHNVSASYVSGTINSSNSTLLNLSQTNNTQIDLSLFLDCTTPYGGMYITKNTLLCPGTFIIPPESGVHTIMTVYSSVNLTCDNTIIDADKPTGNSWYYAWGIFSQFTSNVTISGCTIKDTFSGIYALSSNNFTISNNNLSSNYQGMYLYTSGSNITNNQLDGNSQYGVYLIGNNNSLTDNAASGSNYAFSISGSYNSLYHNNISSNIYNIGDIQQENSYNHTININGTLYNQGNKWDDYCDKGLDLDGDGYADNVSSATANDWPYSASISSKINGPYVFDYAPKKTTCVTEVFLSSSSSSGGGSASTTTAATSTLGPTPAVTSPSSVRTPPVTPTTESYTAEEAKKFIKTNIATQRVDELTTQVKVTLENTGTKKMLLFPGLEQQTDDPYFIVTRKTLGTENSLFSQISSLAYSDNSIAGRLLKAEIVNPEQIILNPGEKVEKTIEIKEGLVIPRQIKIQFTTFGSTVYEQEVKTEKRAVSGTAVDIDSDQKLLDLYAVIVPEEVSKQIEAQAQNNGLTGAAVVDFTPSGQDYLLEVSIAKKGSSGTLFGDIYGPYTLKEGKTFVFAQQIKYDHSKYQGDVVIRTKIYHAGKVIAENEFPINMG